MLSARATRGLEAGLLAVLGAPLLKEWAETASASSRLSYALIVPVLALVLALRARPVAGPAAPAESRLPGALLALGAALLLVLGTLTGVFTLSLLAVPFAVAAYTARWSGTAGLRCRAPALLLLLAMVPPPMPVMDRLNPALIEASGQTAVALLRPFDAEVSWIGSNLAFRGWDLVVAEACSGSGSFLALGVLCAFLAGLFHVRPCAATLLVALSFPLTLALNGLRIATSALIIDRYGAAAGEGLAHELLGQAVLIAGAALLALAVERFSSARVARAGAVA